VSGTALRIHRFDTVASTQDLAHALAQGGAPAGTAVVAREQTLGRGSRGRSWAAPAGGLWISILCRPRAAPAAEVLSLRAALVVAAAIEAACPGLRLLLKWPNDLLLGGRKLGGILSEARWQGSALGWIVVGVGINVANPIPPELAASAIALASAVPGATPAALEEPVARAVLAAAERAGGLTADELAAYRQRDWLLGRRLAAPVPGIADGIDADGALRVIQGDGTVAPVRSGTVAIA
jgi:BirA family biotin operon repressor/biotin-[acetyl-CoA-carboxylase] ligase